MLLPLILQVALELDRSTLHHHTLKVTLDFLFKVCEWFRILVDLFLDLDFEIAQVVEPSVTGSDKLERSFELDQN